MVEKLVIVMINAFDLNITTSLATLKGVSGGES